MGSYFRHNIKNAVILSTALLASCTTTQTSQLETDRQFDKQTGKLVMAAQKLAAFGRFSEAMTELEAARKQPDLIPYEVSTILSMMGAYAYEMDNIPDSIVYYKNAIAANGLLPQEVENYQSNIGQLLIVNGQYTEGAEALSDWMKANGETARFNKMVMQAYVKDKNYSAALPFAEKWFASGEADTERPADILLWLQTDEINHMP